MTKTEQPSFGTAVCKIRAICARSRNVRSFKRQAQAHHLKCEGKIFFNEKEPLSIFSRQPTPAFF